MRIAQATIPGRCGSGGCFLSDAHADEEEIEAIRRSGRNRQRIPILNLSAGDHDLGAPNPSMRIGRLSAGHAAKEVDEGGPSTTVRLRESTTSDQWIKPD